MNRKNTLLPMKKKGIILLITLSFITLVTVIVALYYTLVENSMARNQKSKFLVQANVFMYDFKHNIMPLITEQISALETTLENVSDDDLEKYGSMFAELLGDCAGESKEKMKICIFNQFYGIPLSPSAFSFGDNNTSSELMDWKLECSPGNKEFNINMSRDFNDSFRYIYEDNFKNFLTSEYKLISTSTLFELINYSLAVTPKEESYLFGKDELKINSVDLENKKISGKDLWNKIIDDYYSLTEEKEIYKVPWDKLIGFEGEYLDFNQISPELCKIIFPIKGESDEELCVEPSKTLSQEEVLDGLDENEKTFAIGAKLYYKFNPILDCKLNYNSSDVDGTFSFRYTVSVKDSNQTQGGDSNQTQQIKVENFKMILR
ncbi:MAG: hypothetical protein OIF32_01925 [Campylobacterales bacterium]|nr:hypothetical protein [Campylobacterales bacterium]